MPGSAHRRSDPSRNPGPRPQGSARAPSAFSKCPSHDIWLCVPSFGSMRPESFASARVAATADRFGFDVEHPRTASGLRPLVIQTNGDGAYLSGSS